MPGDKGRETVLLHEILKHQEIADSKRPRDIHSCSIVPELNVRAPVTKIWLGAVASSRSGFWRSLKRNRFVRQTNGDIERARIAPVDAVVGPHDPSDDDPTVKTRTIEQRLEYLFSD